MGGEWDPKLYGRRTGHRKRREMLKVVLAREGAVACARCGLEVYHSLVLAPDGRRTGKQHVPSCRRGLACNGECWIRWDLGHADEGSEGGIEHRSCNRSAGGRNGALKVNAARRQRRDMVIRHW